MRLKRTNEFRRDAVRIALTSGLTRKQVADDLGVGMSPLNIEYALRHWSERTCERSQRIETRMWFRRRSEALAVKGALGASRKRDRSSFIHRTYLSDGRRKQILFVTEEGLGRADRIWPI